MQHSHDDTEVKGSIGLVIAHFGQRITIETREGKLIQSFLRRNQPLPVVGDEVEFQTESDETGIVLHILPRHSLLQRGDAHGREKPLAANVDILAIVMSPPPILSEELVDRYAVAAELLNLTPIIVINKKDLLKKREQKKLQASLSYYEVIGYQVIFSSCLEKNGLQDLLKALRGKRAVLVGPSGVGKSSIIKCLAELDNIQIGNVTNKGIGKHTTTATRLYHLPEGGELIDSPGVRDFNLWQINESLLFQGFKEFAHYVSCRFRDCRHLAEPDCGVRHAVEQGKISESRYRHYSEGLKNIKF